MAVAALNVNKASQEDAPYIADEIAETTATIALLQEVDRWGPETDFSAFTLLTSCESKTAIAVAPVLAH